MGSNSETHMKQIQLSGDDDDEAHLSAMLLARAAVLPMVLRSAIELDVLEIIKQSTGPMSASEIVSRLPTKNPDAVNMLERILRLLASFSILTGRTVPVRAGEGSVERVYEIGPVCKYLTKNEDGVSLSALCIMSSDEVFMKSWYHLKDAVLEGGTPFIKAYGMNSFEYSGTDTRFNKVFNNGMYNHTRITMKKILETYRGFQGLGTLVDVGGGIGANLSMIVSKYPTIKGINFDLPHVIQAAPTYSEGIEHVGGDMFESVPKGDAIFMKWICHDWSDEHCLKLLKNCHESIPDNGKVIVAECILSEDLTNGNPDEAKLVMLNDCIMMTQNPGGKERTQKEFETLAKAAGFRGFRVVCNGFDTYIMELLKNKVM